MALILATIFFGVMTPSNSLDAKVRRSRDLTVTQTVALQESERRLDMYDRALKALTVARKRGEISRREFGYEERDLVGFIGCEARYQNDILIDDRPFPPEDVREVMENIAKYAILVPAYILGAAAIPR
jgi:hypothetical protein